MPAAAQIGAAQHFFQLAGGHMLPPLFGTFGRHDNVVRAGPPRPHVEVLPFQKRIDRSADVEGQSMRFGPDKQDYLRVRRDLPNRLRERFQLLFRLLARQFDVDEIEPAAGHHCDRACETQGQDATQARLRR